GGGGRGSGGGRGGVGGGGVRGGCGRARMGRGSGGGRWPPGRGRFMIRGAKGSCRQHFDAGKSNLVPSCDLKGARCGPTNKFTLAAGHRNAHYAQHMRSRRPTCCRASPPALRISPLRKKSRDLRFRCR